MPGGLPQACASHYIFTVNFSQPTKCQATFPQLGRRRPNTKCPSGNLLFGVKQTYTCLEGFHKHARRIISLQLTSANQPNAKPPSLSWVDEGRTLSVPLGTFCSE